MAFVAFVNRYLFDFGSFDVCIFNRDKSLGFGAALSTYRWAASV
jgi:hypothetical protein